MKKPFALFTMTRNEALFLRVWCNYYCPLFSPDNVFILDHSGQDDSVSSALQRNPGMHVTEVQHTATNDHVWMRGVVQETQTALLEDYEVVVYAETDEFLIPSADESLVDLLERFRTDPEAQAIRATGWHPIHQFKSGEPALVLSEGESILANRSSMWRLPSYDKTLVTKVPLDYDLGFHTVIGDDSPASPTLILLHAWMVDLTIFRQKRLMTVLDAQTNLLTRRLGRFTSSGDRTPVPEEWKPALVW